MGPVLRMYAILFFEHVQCCEREWFNYLLRGSSPWQPLHQWNASGTVQRDATIGCFSRDPRDGSLGRHATIAGTS